MTMENDYLSAAEKLIEDLIIKGYVLEHQDNLSVTEKGKNRLEELPDEIIQYRFVNQALTKEYYNSLLNKIKKTVNETCVNEAEKLIYLEIQSKLLSINFKQSFNKESYH